MSLRSAAEILVKLTEARELERAHPLVAIEDGYLVVFHREADGTERHHTYIEVSHLRHWPAAMEWLLHISEKTWVTTKHLQRAMQAIQRINAN